jgi:hypothetical protein
MKQWTATYRDKNGSKTSVIIEAEDRAGVFAELKKRGISAISVAEGASNKKSRKAVGGGASPKGRVFIAAAVAVLIAGVAAWLMWPDAEKPVGEKGESKKQMEAAHVQSIKVKAEPKAEVKPEKPKRLTKKGTPIPDRVQKDARGVYRYPNGQRWVDPNDLNIVKHPKPRLLFKNTSENQIAVLLRLDPTRMAPFLIGRRLPYGERFVKDFVKSLDETPVVYDKNDTPEEAALRQAVIETKAELKAAMDRGEDIAKIMNDTQKELDRLCQYHNDLKKMVKEAVDNPEFTDKDVEDYVTAANEMLKKQGLNGLTMPNLVNRQARLLMMKERKKALEAKKALESTK